MPFKKVDPKVSFPKMEEEILKYWEDNRIFEKSVSQREGAPRYSFYDGPPFATGLPHYGHLVGSIMKDVVPRYWTMKGYQVERKWGWDCHGLPIENIAEKELGIKHKKDIETMGVAKFNEFCRSKVMGYAAEWEKIIPRVGRWADMKHAYKTMDRDYMESIWWVFKELWDKGLIYESYRSMHVCPRCETTLSQQEVAEGYKDVKDLSVVAKFELVDEPGTYVLAWTTTPWTLPGNVALAMNRNTLYTKSKVTEINGNSNFKLGETYIFAKNRAKTAAHEIFGGKLGIFQVTIFDENDGVLRSAVITNNDGSETQIIFDSVDIAGEKLVGKSYKPLFDYYAKDTTLANHENGWKIYAADFVTTEDGTGVVHIAPAFGEDDMELGKKENLPFIQHVKMDGTMKDEVTDFAGMSVKPLENPQACDIEIIKHLAHKGLLFAKEKYEHSYPHCWRCDTPLLNYATSSWFVSVTKVKERALELAKEINWSPAHIKDGRFGKWLEGARDWSISRQRYWASVMPIWKCECGEMRVFGSVKELEDASGKKVDDLHKHIVDEITVPCEKCNNTMSRVPDVLDTWFDSGSMPYAQAHYPFENKEKFEAGFPAQYIAEGIDQTRAWFYYLHVLGTAIKDKPAFRNVIVNGIVLAEDGKKMSKKLKNYPDPMEIVEKHGADALRLYLLSSPIVSAENLNFSERELSDSTKNVFRMLWNTYSFFTMYANLDKWVPKTVNDELKPANVLDRWILSELQMLVQDVNVSMASYDLIKATRALSPFVDNLSNWYIRRSRKRFWKSEDDADKESAYATLHHVLVELSKLMAPFTPFLAEEMYRNLTGKESVHLAEYPKVDESLIDEKLNLQMALVRAIVNDALANRATAGIKVRQPLADVTIGHPISEELQTIIMEEINVKAVRIIPSNDKPIAELNLTITPELALEGQAREIIRAVQEGRKAAGFNVEDRISLGYKGMGAVFADENLRKLIVGETLAEGGITEGELEGADHTETVDLDGEKISFWLKKNV